MRVLIADDEPIARQVLREHLEEIAGVDVVGEAADGVSAVEQIARLRPDLVFLDLQMPLLDGFAVARSLGAVKPALIYLTAFEAHALEAFEVGAVDYLLKPIRRERLERALQKVKQQTAAPRKEEAGTRRVVGKLGTDMHLIDPSEVIAFQADGEVVYVLTAKGRYFATHTLRALEEKMEQPRFRRVHRKTIINTDHIRKISPLSSKRWLLKMSNGLEVVVSKRLAGLIRDETRW